MIDIKHIANLAKLSLTDKEIKSFGEELSRVLEHFKELNRMNTGDAEPLITASDIEYWMREDKAVKTTTAEDAVSNAPDRAGNLFKVPPVV